MEKNGTFLWHIPYGYFKFGPLLNVVNVIFHS